MLTGELFMSYQTIVFFFPVVFFTRFSDP